MMLLIKNIKELLQVRHDEVRFVAGKAMQTLPTLQNAFLQIRDGRIDSFGSMEQCPSPEEPTEVIDATGKIVLPAWCDSHTHLVYAGNREGEFVDRIKGLSYEEIAKKGGGILNSAAKLQGTSEEDLFQQSKVRLEEVIKLGTGAIEIKSGYGLTPEAELKMLRVIKRLGEAFPIPIKATYLAAHALPGEFSGKTQEFLRMMTEEVLPEIANSHLADYIDVFCETGYFSLEDTEYVLSSAKAYGLVPKIHVNQFNAFGGVALAVKHQALSVDHLEILRDEDIDALKGAETMPVALPGCSFFLGIPYTPARQLIDAGLPLALATDYNPGSAPSGNMNFVVSAATVKMGLTPEEAINAATINGAYAMGLEEKVGSIAEGKQANLILTKPISSYNALPYAFGSDQIDEVFLSGRKQIHP